MDFVSIMSMAFYVLVLQATVMTVRGDACFFVILHVNSIRIIVIVLSLTKHIIFMETMQRCLLLRLTGIAVHWVELLPIRAGPRIIFIVILCSRLQKRSPSGVSSILLKKKNGANQMLLSLIFIIMMRQQDSCTVERRVRMHISA